ncbi:MAG: GIY-YIG nuclease family protein [Clostridiaceae bacterium]|nr:GIY-YIG nuclease family protein [Clostridiaceae bacterium]
MFEIIRELLSARKSLSEKQNELSRVNDQIAQQTEKLSSLEADCKIKEDAILQKDEQIAKRDQTIAEIQQQVKEEQEKIIADYAESVASATESAATAQEQEETLKKRVATQQAKLESIKTLHKAIKKAIDQYDLTDIPGQLNLTEEQVAQLNEIVPSVELPLRSNDIRDLRTLNRENSKRVDEILARYEKRYTTKSNRAIYQLMVLALRAELQNILHSIKFSQLDKCLASLDEMTAKFLKIASDGNQAIAPTLNNFIAEIHELFDSSIRVEYEYFVRKEKERAEQQALREQMRQEAEERKLLEQQQRQVEKEESKYTAEIGKVQAQLAELSPDDEKSKTLEAKIAELQAQLAAVEQKKEEIISRQNGKAGYVYVISNLGSFGDKTFKIGMTRRLDPMDRIKELGDASVPFSFDVHSFIFSDDAVGLESELHKRLDSKRKNKINLRKEFFDISLDELERLVQEINPAAEFNRTMLATEYRQSQEMLQ